MTTLNREASRAALEAGAVCATDVTGFGLLGHLFKLLRASGVSAEVDAAAVPYVDGARQALADGFVPGGSRRNLDWVRPHCARTSTEVPGYPVIGRTTARGAHAIVVR